MKLAQMPDFLPALFRHSASPDQMHDFQAEKSVSA
jgi:hypothetical protein